MSIAMIEKTTVTFDLCDKCLTVSAVDVQGIAFGMLSTASMIKNGFAPLASEKFRNVTAFRALGDGKTLNNTQTWTSKGPFSPLQMVQMMQYKKNISNDTWLAHMNRYGLVEEVPTRQLRKRIKVSEWT